MWRRDKTNSPEFVSAALICDPPGQSLVEATIPSTLSGRLGTQWERGAQTLTIVDVHNRIVDCGKVTIAAAGMATAELGEADIPRLVEHAYRDPSYNNPLDEADRIEMASGIHLGARDGRRLTQALIAGSGLLRLARTMSLLVPNDAVQPIYDPRTSGLRAQKRWDCIDMRANANDSAALQALNDGAPVDRVMLMLPVGEYDFGDKSTYADHLYLKLARNDGGEETVYRLTTRLTCGLDQDQTAVISATRTRMRSVGGSMIPIPEEVKTGYMIWQMDSALRSTARWQRTGLPLSAES